MKKKKKAALRARMLTYMEAHPNRLYTSGYDEQISDEEANMLLAGDFEGFDESLWERVQDWDDQGYLWDDWESEFASEFDYESWAAMPDWAKEFAHENRLMDESEWIKEVIQHWKGNVTATILKPGAKEPENLIYAPAYPEDRGLARYLVDAFGLDLKATEGTLVERVAQTLEVIYGGYDREQLILIGRVDLLPIYEAQKAPNKVKIGPEDADHLLFYEFHNGCGNMGGFPLTKTRVMPARLKVDGSHGYGVDACYGFTGSHWRHEIRIA